jgi:hypothetical protein
VTASQQLRNHFATVPPPSSQHHILTFLYHRGLINADYASGDAKSLIFPMMAQLIPSLLEIEGSTALPHSAPSSSSHSSSSLSSLDKGFASVIPLVVSWIKHIADAEVVLLKVKQQESSNNNTSSSSSSQHTNTNNISNRSETVYSSEDPASLTAAETMLPALPLNNPQNPIGSSGFGLSEAKFGLYAPGKTKAKLSQLVNTTVLHGSSGGGDGVDSSNSDSNNNSYGGQITLSLMDYSGTHYLFTLQLH